MSHYDLIVLGAGSGNMLPGDDLRHLRTAIVEPDRFGGTCLNRGCIPTKMFVVAAEAASNARAAARLGIHATVDTVNWKEIRDRIFGRIDPLHEKALAYRRENGIDVYTEPARFVAPKTVLVGSERLTADTFVVAAGSRPKLPPIPGLSDVPYHTSDTVMRIDEIPTSVLIVGGGFIAAEFGHVFASFGSQVTIVQSGPRLLMAEDEQVSAAFTEAADHRHRLFLEAQVSAVRPDGAGITATVAGPAGEVDVHADLLLICTGRRPNTDLINAAAGGLTLDEHGHVVTDEAYRTGVPGVWALGDVANHFQLKHMANAEVRVVAHNLQHPGAERGLTSPVAPHAVFTEPQIASVGLTEQDARTRNVDHVVALRRYSDTAYGWALEDTTGFAKLLVDPTARTLLGAHIFGPHAALLIQPLIQAMSLGQTVDQIARDVLYIHPALTELIEQALLDVPSPARTEHS
ncbi:mycothione reductase [Parafrankia sp. FMc2]|uniref:mycothione reductase n=1 Tax=Parafrankia sp. FMc2 TaxID=3233196 RepID=UPI0034D71AAE